MSLHKDLSPLGRIRAAYVPALPSILKDLATLKVVEKNEKEKSFNTELNALFPFTYSQPFLEFTQSLSQSFVPLKVGVVFSGGQASGGHNVISGLLDALLKLNAKSCLMGFLDGPKGIVENKYITIDLDNMASYRNQGGFDLIGSGRTKIETTQQFEAIEKNVRALGLDGLVIIGGDDSNTNAAFIAEYFKQKNLKTSVVGVPKTIDGDLQNEFIEISFGYDTACKIYSEFIGNLAKDALSAKKYYFFVKMMGRSASHVALECAIKTQINLALIGEEIADLKMTLKQVIDTIVNLICQRASVGKNYGVILIPEGIIEFISEFKVLLVELNRLHAEIEKADENKLERISQLLTPLSARCLNDLPANFQKQLLFDRDPHGNIQVSKIETERLIIQLVEQELIKRKNEQGFQGEFNAQPLFCGYEGRSGLPSNFDCHYCYSLGHLAAVLVNSQMSGYMACINKLDKNVEQWEICGTPITRMLHLEQRKGKMTAVIQKGLVNLKGKLFKFYQSKKSSWMLEDAYLCPGPIQYEGEREITEAPPLILNFIEKK